MTKKHKDLLVFGYGLAVILSVFALRFLAKHKSPTMIAVLLVCALVMAVATLFRSKILEVIYERWMGVAHFIGAVVTTIILTVLFYGVFGVVGIVLRLMGKDLLDQKIEAKKKSYWIPRPTKAFEKKSYTRQF